MIRHDASIRCSDRARARCVVTRSVASGCRAWSAAIGHAAEHTAAVEHAGVLLIELESDA